MGCISSMACTSTDAVWVPGLSQMASGLSPIQNTPTSAIPIEEIALRAVFVGTRWTSRQRVGGGTVRMRSSKKLSSIMASPASMTLACRSSPSFSFSRGHGFNHPFVWLILLSHHRLAFSYCCVSYLWVFIAIGLDVVPVLVAAFPSPTGHLSVIARYMCSGVLHPWV